MSNAPDLPVCDEIGYLPLGKQVPNLFFQLISERYEQKSTIIDSTSVATTIAARLVLPRNQKYRRPNI